MRVSLGTVEVSDETRKAIRRAKGGKGQATRAEVKEFALARLDEQLNAAGRPARPAGGEVDEEQEQQLREASHTEYRPDPQGGGMPEPTPPAAPATGTPTTGQTTPTSTGTTPGTV